MPESRRELPTGTVTFLFTDIEGSTRLVQALGSAYPRLLDRHAALVRETIAAHDGREVSTEGDAFFVVFRAAKDAVAAAAGIQRALADEAWPPGAAIRVRIGLHTGEAQAGGDNYTGLDVHRAARIASAAHGGQVLLSAATASLCAADLPPGIGVRQLGRHRLKDLAEPELLHQLVVDGLPATFPPPRAGRLGNLPVPATSFVGRDDERRALRELIDRERLVTLVGPGGTGKTRLAIALAGEIAEELPDGAFFVPLDTVAEADLVPSAILRTLELTEPGDGDPLSAVREYLADRELLLVLDNFEQILAAATAVDAIRAAAPNVRLIVTSRAPLGLYGEQLYPVPPLDSPDPRDLPPLEQLSQYAAVSLFVARARAVKPDFSVTNENAPAVAEICARLDGLPLAIELAAARVALLPPEAIVRRLDARLQLLASSAVNLPERQRTLRGAIDWSYELLAEPDRVVLARLGVFSGGADLDAIERVVDPDRSLGRDLLDALATLVGNSLVRQREAGGEARFGLLETIREFALERLASSGDADAVRGRHADLMRELADAAESDLSLSGGTAYGRVTAEYDNLRAAIRWCLDAGRAETALAIAGAIWRWWQREGLLVEGRWWCDEVLRHPDAAARTAARAKALGALGSIAYWQGDMASMRPAYEESLAIYRELGDESGTAWALFNLGFVGITSGDIEPSRALFADALERFRALGDERGISEALFIVGYTELLAGNLAGAEGPLEEVLARTSYDWLRRADALIGVGQIQRAAGRPEEARATILESLQLAQDRRDMGILIGAIEVLGVLEVEAGRVENGARILGAGRGARRRTGGGPPASLMFLGDVAEQAEQALGRDRLEALMAEGETLTPREITALVESRAAVPAPP